MVIPTAVDGVSARRRSVEKACTVQALLPPQRVSPRLCPHPFNLFPEIVLCKVIVPMEHLTQLAPLGSFGLTLLRWILDRQVDTQIKVDGMNNY